MEIDKKFPLFGGADVDPRPWSVLRKAVKVEQKPFPHIIIENAVRLDIYNQLLALRPKVPGDKPNTRYDIRAVNGVKMGWTWQQFIEHHCSRAFYEEVDRLFDLGLKGKVGMRYRDDTEIRMDCQISINTPNTGEPERVCIAHRDNPETKWAGLLYMGTNDAGLEIYDCKPEFFGKRRVSNPGEPVKTVPFNHNTFIGFKNTENAIHAPEPRTQNKTREFVNFCIDGG